MAIFIAVVRGDHGAGFTASFPDFPGLALHEPTLDQLLAKAREVLAQHIETMLGAGKTISLPTPAHAIPRNEVLLVAAVDVPDDLGIAHVDLEIPALALARIDSVARRYGLTRSALFVQAVDHWATLEGIPRDGRSEASGSLTLFDFVNPSELKVEPTATAAYPPLPPESSPSAPEVTTAEVSISDIAAELERLIEGSQGSKPTRAAEWRPANMKGE
jgi:predicted RNase H-like HicB family nuclease